MSGRGWTVVLGTAALLVLAGLAWWRGEGGAPQVKGPEVLHLGASGGELELELADDGSGLRVILVTLEHAGGSAPLLAEDFPGGWLLGGGEPARSVALAIDPQALGLAEGNAFLRVSVRDWSWRGGLRGNETRLDVPVEIDLTPPRIRVASGATYVNRGGAALVAYDVSEDAVRDGVRVGDHVFRGYPAPNGAGRVAIFAVPFETPDDAPVRVFAEDAAGNAALARWPVFVRAVSLRDARVTLPESFLETVAVDLARAEGIPIDDPTEAFRRVNTEVRASNEDRIREIVAGSASEPLWKGRFIQLPNSKVTSRFGERRSYFVDGTEVSQATHYGYDLASTRAAPVPAAGGGRVLFADDLGIYGNCVLLDHGLGLISLYGHLSRVDVAVGDRVDQRQPVGLSGSTGLAGGDHLHFAMLVGGSYVDPLEWWDSKWVRNVEARLVPSAR